MSTKLDIASFWNTAACGERLLLQGVERKHYEQQSAARYELEPHISSFARFDKVCGLRVLEVGTGLGADHQRFAQAGAVLSGVDLTERAIDHTAERLKLFGLSSDLRRADAENLPFADATFDVVYSWGVIHHTPDTAKAASEILRVLRPGGRFAVMIYNRWSLIGLMLWLRYGLFGLKGLARVYAEYVESPGTQAYTRADARRMFPGARIRTVLSSGDLLLGHSGQRHEGRLLKIARHIWPRALIRMFPGLGLFMLIDGHK